jgi:hypothetical protein
MPPQTFFADDQRNGPWRDAKYKRIPTPAELAREQRERAEAEKLQRLKDSRAELGIPDFRDPHPTESAGAYETALKLEQRRRPPPSSQESAEAARKAREQLRAVVGAKAVQS